MIRTINVLIYLALFLAILLFSFFGNLLIRKKIWSTILSIWMPITILILFSTFKRIEVGIDTKHYLDFYQHTAPSLNSFSLLINSKFDFMFALSSHVFASVGLSFRFFLFFLYSLIYIPIGLFISKKSKSPSLSFSIYLGWSFFAFNLSGLRQAVSISLCVLAMLLFNKKNIKSFILSFIIFTCGCLFHYSSVMFYLAFIILIFVPTKPFVNAWIFLLVAGFSLFVASPPLYQLIFKLADINYYIPVLRTDVGALFFLYLTMFLFCYFMVYQRAVITFIEDKINSFFGRFSRDCKTKKDWFSNKNEPLDDFFHLLLIFFVGVLIYSMSAVSNSFVRLALPFLVMSIVIIPESISKIRNISFRNVSYFFIALAFIGLFFYLHIVPNDMNICPNDVYIF